MKHPPASILLPSAVLHFAVLFKHSNRCNCFILNFFLSAYVLRNRLSDQASSIALACKSHLQLIGLWFYSAIGEHLDPHLIFLWKDLQVFYSYVYYIKLASSAASVGVGVNDMDLFSLPLSKEQEGRHFRRKDLEEKFESEEGKHRHGVNKRFEQFPQTCRVEN
ncbi:hypothetical protein SDJN02_13560, partial [Cucurbita argyrosperma subsp. argyrosperma]